jgi:HEPN domain-containing protein
MVQSLYAQRTTHSVKWLAKAAEDLAVAQLVLPENHLAHVCFLSQQCIEKALKSYLINR